jgi:hypothetical protein
MAPRSGESLLAPRVVVGATIDGAATVVGTDDRRAVVACGTVPATMTPADAGERP